MDNHNLRTGAETYIRNYFSTHTDARLVYHNLQHTEKVVSAAGQIADHYQLDEQTYDILVVAAWFHDIGYFIDPATHEEKGIELATAFLQSQAAGEEVIRSVSDCIRATRMPQAPGTLTEQILCDADLFHLGTDDFGPVNKMLRKEVEALKGKKIGKDLWRQSTIALMESHHYHTDYCRLLLNDRKSKNLEQLRQKAETADAAPAGPSVQQESLPHAQAATASGPGKDKSKPDRGIETMFRITSNNNQRLSDMADNKAHIMITVNSIILSAIISLLLGKIPKQEYLAIPTYLILAVSVVAIIFSILATRPTLPGGRFTQQDIADKNVNLLFFGNFYKMNLDEYSAGMWQVMNDKEFLYGSLIRDVYSQGVVLGRKYRLLRISYSIFMFGLILSVLAFVIASSVHAA